MCNLKQWWCRGLIFGLILFGSGFGPSTSNAYAMDRKVKTVLTAGGYGAIVGTAVGLLSYPLTQNIQATFIGSSIGLYLGIFVGFYHIFSQGDPQNPLYYQQRPKHTFESTGHRLQMALAKPDFELSFTVYRF